MLTYHQRCSGGFHVIVISQERPVNLFRNMWRHYTFKTLHWRHNDHDGVSNYQPHGCLLNRLFRRRSKKTSKLRATGLCVGNSPGPVNSPHKGPATRKVFPFDDVIMITVTSPNGKWVNTMLYPEQNINSLDSNLWLKPDVSYILLIYKNETHQKSFVSLSNAGLTKHNTTKHN